MKLPLPLSSGIWGLQDPPDMSFVLGFVLLTPAFLLSVFYWGSAKNPGCKFDICLPAVGEVTGSLKKNPEFHFSPGFSLVTIIIKIINFFFFF